MVHAACRSRTTCIFSILLEALPHLAGCTLSTKTTELRESQSRAKQKEYEQCDDGHDISYIARCDFGSPGTLMLGQFFKGRINWWKKPTVRQWNILQVSTWNMFKWCVSIYRNPKSLRCILITVSVFPPWSLILKSYGHLCTDSYQANGRRRRLNTLRFARIS